MFRSMKGGLALWNKKHVAIISFICNYLICNYQEKYFMKLNLHEFLPYRFNRLADELSKNASVAYKKSFGMNRPEWRVFALLGQFGTLTATEITNLSAMHKTKVSRAVYALENKRWLLREQDNNDRRVEKIALTKIGEEKYKQLIPEILKIERDLVDKLGEADTKALLQGLSALEKMLIEGSHGDKP